MRTITFSNQIVDKGHVSVSKSLKTKNVIASFTSENYVLNAAHVHMSAIEARAFALQLIVYAAKLEDEIERELNGEIAPAKAK